MEPTNLILIFPNRSVDMVTLPFIPRTGEYILQPGRRLRVLGVTYDTVSEKRDTNVRLDVEEVEAIEKCRKKARKPSKSLTKDQRAV